MTWNSSISVCIAVLNCKVSYLESMNLEQQHQCLYHRVELYSVLPGDHDLEQQHQRVYRRVEL